MELTWTWPREHERAAMKAARDAHATARGLFDLADLEQEARISLASNYAAITARLDSGQYSIATAVGMTIYRDLLDLIAKERRRHGKNQPLEH